LIGLLDIEVYDITLGLFIADYLWIYRIATMQSFAKPDGAASLRVDSFASLRTGSSLCSG
jgi:hypothetical protein